MGRKHPGLGQGGENTNSCVLQVITPSQWPLRRRQWHSTPVLLPGKSQGRRSLEGCSPWGRWESDTTEQLHFHFSLTCTREGNGNPLQCSCLENPRDGGAWWAAVYGAAQSRTRLKRLSSSSSHFGMFSLLMLFFMLILVGPVVTSVGMLPEISFSNSNFFFMSFLQDKS